MKKISLITSIMVLFIGCGGGNSSNDTNITTENTNTTSTNTPTENTNTTSTKVTAEDGYIKNAKVYFESNNSLIGSTNEDGVLTTSIDLTNQYIKIEGGIDTFNDSNFTMPLYGYVNDNDIVISPISSLIVKLMKKGKTYEDAKNEVSKNLNISLDKVEEDFIANNDTDILKKSWKIVALSNFIKDNLDLDYDNILDVISESNSTNFINNLANKLNLTQLPNGLSTNIQALLNFDPSITDTNITKLQNEVYTQYNLIGKGYYQNVINVNSNSDYEFNITLPAGDYYIFAEYSGNDSSIEAEFGDINNQNIKVISQSTSSTRPAQIEINASGKYIIPIHALKNNQKTNATLWIGVIDSNTTKLTYMNNKKLKLNEINKGEIVQLAPTTQYWTFDVNSTESGLYDLNVTTLSENPLLNYSVEINCNSKEILSANDGSTTTGSLYVRDLNLSGNCTLTISNIANEKDQLGFYQIQLIKQ